ncbi:MULTISPECIES: tRNA (mnm(5)s(2)U34)-methyltransferase [Paenibacillus]|uniref:SAM-dependent methyltransferase n=1 Tax=Paenibacillus cineris TaxID=237530 RepID=A0ABQ4L6C3_9BACL|nr:class I SAM-dependent methyltransferase [Paenibacillus cineris]GIO52136.1 SAM-dependent methyltransferase [Paenibacillus cineris]
MGFLSVLSFAHKQIAERLSPGDIAVDATIGTGADTLFLAKTAGPKGHVYGFDVQEHALTLTRQRLAQEAPERIAPVTLYLQSHAAMREALPEGVHGRVGAVMFNLGYLPAEEADKAVITTPDSTIEALEAGLSLLRRRGIMTAVLYPGHAGGDLEAQAVTAWATALPQSSAQAVIYRQLQRADAPYVIALEKK